MGLKFSKWKIARTCFPYPSGWGTYRTNRVTGQKVILDTGLTKEAAEKAAKELNKIP